MGTNESSCVFRTKRTQKRNSRAYFMPGNFFFCILRYLYRSFAGKAYSNLFAYNGLKDNKKRIAFEFRRSEFPPHSCLIGGKEEIGLEIVCVLALGILLGCFLVPQRLSRALHHLVQAGIVLLLFSMGVSLGAGDGFWENLKSMGLSSLIYAVLSTAGGVGLVILVSHLLPRYRKGEKP